MKTLLLSLFLLIPLTACSTEPSSETVYLKIDGMTCTACSQTLEKKFSKEDTIQSVSINADKGTGKLVQKPGMKIKDVTIEKIVDWSGFELISIER